MIQGTKGLTFCPSSCLNALRGRLFAACLLGDSQSRSSQLAISIRDERIDLKSPFFFLSTENLRIRV